MTTVTAASVLARQVADDQDEFARDAREAADLLGWIAEHPEESRVLGDLSRLSQQVTELVRRAARIKASTEALRLMEAEAGRATEK
ncbi:hypothetical protein ACIBAI_28610 [Streptomyces sp. NPDC051041]|uniref:hypothetical protein n=1 Tax=Streptomyces sp. NPDC051041 TaxID=3365640 RepID=UPI0037B153CE